jgi:hypothetical protein
MTPEQLHFVPVSKTAIIQAPKPNRQIRRVFDNSQILDRFGQWLLICGKAENTRKAYVEAAEQFARFLDKPLAAATKGYVRRLEAVGVQRRAGSNYEWFVCLDR